MQLVLSNLAFMGFNYKQLKDIPADMGLEIFCEFGTNVYWDKVLGEVYAGYPLRGFGIHGPCVGINLADPYDTGYLSQYKNVFEFASRRRAEYVVVHTNEDYDEEAAFVREQVKGRLNEILTLAEKYRIKILVENVGLNNKGTLLFDWPEYQELIRSLPQAGALIDVGHAHVNGWPLPEVIERLGDRIKAYHLHDNHGVEDEHLPIGQGKVEWERLFTAIRLFSAGASLVLEYANVDFAALLNNIDMIKKDFLLSD